MSSVDVVYLAWNRAEFTDITIGLLLANTDWNQVDRLIVYDDGSTDGTRELLAQSLAGFPVEHELRDTAGIGPPAIMNHYIRSRPAADWWVKLDNDIALPPGWLSALLAVRDREPGWDAVGFEAGRTGIPGIDIHPWDGIYRGQQARWIGGVGLLRTGMFGRHAPIPERGRFGWTEAQMRRGWNLGWITPDLMVPQLDRVPAEPYASWSARYIEEEWQRPWPQMDPHASGPYFQWLPHLEEQAA